MRARNVARIREIAARAPTDLEALALLFEDDTILDDGTVAGRARALLEATGRKSIPGLQTACRSATRGSRATAGPAARASATPGRRVAISPATS